jgi:prefoldin subunit 5
MTRAEMENAINNLDARFARVEQILPTLATKQDLKEALAAYATKEDLKATAEDLRAEISGVRSQLMAMIESVQSDVRLIAEHLAGVLEWIREQRAKP